MGQRITVQCSNDLIQNLNLVVKHSADVVEINQYT